MSDFQIIDVPGHGRVEFPASMNDAEITAVIQRTLQEQPARMNPNLQAQGESGRANMTPPESVTDPRYPAYAKAQRQAEDFGVLSGLAGAVIGAVAAPGSSLMRRGAESMMQKAVKPYAADLASGKAGRAVKTMLDEGVLATSGGMDKLRRIGGALNTQADDIIRNATGSVDKVAAAAPAQRVVQQAQFQATPLHDMKVAQGVIDEFTNHPLLAGQQSMPVQLAQALKQGTYKTLGDSAYGLGLKPAAERDALKAIASGLRTGIESAAPAVAPVNARAADIWNALNVANRRLLVTGNNNPLGLTSLAGNPVGAAAFALDRSALAKSLLAHGLNKAQRVPGAIAGGAAGYYLGQENQ